MIRTLIFAAISSGILTVAAVVAMRLGKSKAPKRNQRLSIDNDLVTTNQMMKRVI